MRADRLLAVAIVLTAAVSFAAAPRRHAAAKAPLPAGSGRAIAERACVICHSTMLITQQAKDSTAWEKTLGTMTKWGAPLTPAEHDSLVRYLVTTRGPRALK